MFLHSLFVCILRGNAKRTHEYSARFQLNSWRERNKVRTCLNAVLLQPTKQRISCCWPVDTAEREQREQQQQMPTPM